MNTIQEKKYEIYLKVLSCISGYITHNLKRLYLDIDIIKEEALITAYYNKIPNELELELLDDIETNSISKIENIIFNQSIWFLSQEIRADEYKYHDFLLFSFYEE